MPDFSSIAAQMLNGKVETGTGEIKTYPASLATYGGDSLLMVKVGQRKYLLAVGGGDLYKGLSGSEENNYKICPLTHENRLVLNKYFPYTVPRAFGKEVPSMGLGDRLGLAGSGHIKAIKDTGVKPVLAQQSIRELNLTHRDYRDVLDAAVFAVFQEGYDGGFGADGDHLKKEEDIQNALQLGFSMITLDCSEKIDNNMATASKEQLEAKYNSISPERRESLERLYLETGCVIEGTTISFSLEELMRTVLIYREAIDFVVFIYNKYIKSASREIDFEISIDETLIPTSPAAHFFVANELLLNGVDFTSLAPRFCGEFQKGIDYIGNLEQFQREFRIHAAIARHFGYKLSIHSGSDKFSVFPVIGAETEGLFHIKTAGTNWLEALRVVAKVNPDLYRRMHQYAWKHFEEARAYYVVTADPGAIVPLEQVSDDDLPGYLDDANARQVLHITYGLLLQAKDENGTSLFQRELFSTLIEHEEEYENRLFSHIGNHLKALGKK